VLLVFLAISAPNLLEPTTINLMLKQSIPTVIVCLGLATVVMAGGDDVVSGGIDLSIPATAILAAAIIADQLTNHQTSLYVALPLAMCAAIAMGLLNAFLVVVIRMTPLLATLASSVACVGVAKVITSSRRINVNDPFIVYLRDGELFGMSVGVLITLVTVLVFYFFVHRTSWGMHLQATGGSSDAAEIAGINTRKLQAHSFVIAAIAGGLASVFVLARGSGSTPGSEENLLLEMVLATFLGAAFSPRRIVTLWGAVLGAVLVTVLSVGFKSIGVDVFWTGCIKGALILLVVASAAYSGRGQ
jgi:ribose transport system permease protein